MKKTTLAVISTIAIAVMVASPVFVLAKENENKNENNGRGNKQARVVQVKNQERKEDKKEAKDQRKEEKKETRSCVKAFGHLLAPGWIKHNGQTDISAECVLPSGIARFFWHRNGNGGTSTTTATTTPDTTAPVISNLNVIRTGIVRAQVSWTTNELSNSAVWLSTTSPVDINSSPAINQSVRVFGHNVVLNNLLASTTYYVVVRSSDASGNTSTSSEVSFTTKASSTPVVVAPLKISNAVATVGTSSVQTTWLTNITADSQVYYSTSTPINIVASSTQAVKDASLVTNHSINVTGLATSTTYYFLIQSKDALNNVSNTGEFSLTTGI